MFSKTLTHVGSLNTNSPSRKELSCSTSQSKGKDSLEPSVHGFFERLFGFSPKRNQPICSIHENNESANPSLEGDGEYP